jgi:lipopolysaccharide assembly outer membrane protein LptD (OstA)
MLITLSSLFSLQAQEGRELQLQQESTDSTELLDTTAISADSTTADSSKRDTNFISKDAIEAKVDYVAEDSMRIDMTSEKVYLYGDAQVNYENIQLNADYIELDMKNNTVLANGRPDSTGKMAGMPIFKEGDQEYQAGKMTYNFKTEKGKIMEVRTQEGEGYIKGNEVKKTGKDIMYIKNGYYTTCNLEEPHFSLATSKLKIIPNDKIITGPTVLKIGEIPTPLGLPFGFFPNKKGRSSGIIIPTYGDSRNLGFFFRDGGFYWGVNDNLDISLTGDIYTLGSWGGKAQSRYVKRYKYNGNLELSYANIRNGYPEFPDFTESNEFFVRWNHSQDAKARPGSRFSANVNAGTRNNFTNNLNSFTQDYLTNTFQSAISYTNSFPGRPFNLTVSARHNQNTQTGAFNMSLPDASFNVSRQYLFKSMGKIGNEWWRSIYKNFGVSYSANASNQLQTNDSNLSINNIPQLSQDFRSGVRHSIPISTSFKLLKYFNLSPTFNYNDVWAFRTFRRSYNSETKQVIRDTVNGFERGGSYNFNTAMTTKIYGMYQFKGGAVRAIRHVMTPQVSFNYQPEINTGQRSYIDSNGRVIEYSIFAGSVYGSPSRRESGRVGFNLLNNLEMKVRDRSDSSGQKKVTIFENLGFSTNYDLSADSLNWAPISINGRTRIGQFFTLQFNGTFDTYGLDSIGRKIDESWKAQSGKLARLTNGSVALNFRLQGGKKDKNKQQNKDKESEYGTEAELEHINAHPEQYIDFSVPWSLSVGYNIRYSKPAYQETITQTLNFSGDLSVTDKWKVAFNSGWDFERQDFTYTSVSINRDLHCWQLAINWVPYGPRQSYMVTLNVKASVLQDLKLNRRRDYYDVIR